jgi:hypothetical protein
MAPKVFTPESVATGDIDGRGASNVARSVENGSASLSGAHTPLVVVTEVSTMNQRVGTAVAIVDFTK